MVNFDRAQKSLQELNLRMLIMNLRMLISESQFSDMNLRMLILDFNIVCWESWDHKLTVTLIKTAYQSASQFLIVCLIVSNWGKVHFPKNLVHTGNFVQTQEKNTYGPMALD